MRKVRRIFVTLIEIETRLITWTSGHTFLHAAQPITGN